MKWTNTIMYVIFFVIVGTLTACGGKKDKPAPFTKNGVAPGEEIDPMKLRGVGPIQDFTLPQTIDDALVASGKELFDAKCTACHRLDKKFIGPSPKGIVERRNPAWIMNMILNPEEMVQKDPLAKKLLMEYNGSPMANQSLTEDEARAILEYFRTL